MNKAEDVEEDNLSAENATTTSDVTVATAMNEIVNLSFLVKKRSNCCEG